jgi:uncharacterized protein YjbI with pentapeptide repeats
MNMRSLGIAILLYMTAMPPVFGSQEENAAIRRFGFFIGANNGGPGLEPLRYAVRDAESMSLLFMEMGGIKQEDNTFLVEPSLNEIQGRLRALRAKIVSLKGKYSRLEFLFYYSGHSDEEGIMLGSDKFSYRDLKDEIRGMPVDMRIVILDSCSSGALTKIKGGSRKPPFLMDNSINMEGYAIMTSSSRDEVSQESDSLKGSYFTYALVSGLRGAADTRGNKRVTLNQAYQYAYQETLAITEETMGGAQHPSYDIHMNGSGDVVMTDLRESTASLKLDADISGRLSIRDDSGILMAEINKQEGSAVELGLEPGSYTVNVEKNKKIYRGEITINEKEKAVFSGGMLAMVGAEKTEIRGSHENQTNQGQPEYIKIPFVFSILPIISTSNKTIVNFQLNIGAGYCDRLEGTSIGLVNITGEDAEDLDLSLVGFTGHDFKGFQASLATFTGNDFKGVQFGLANYVNGNFSVFQAGLVNITGGNFSGFQAGHVNVTCGSFSGFQAGLVNVDPCPFNGCEIGLINLNGETKGLQLGLVNFTTGQDGESVGLMSIVLSNGQTHGELWVDETGFANAAFIHGSKIIYNIYRVGMDTSANLWTYGLGLGVHIPADPFFVNMEIMASSYEYTGSLDGNNLLSQFRVYSGWSILDHLSLIAGISLNFYNRFSSRSPDISPLYNLSHSFNGNFSAWPGIFAGLEF